MTLPARITKIFDIPVLWIGASLENQWDTDGNLPKIGICNHRAQGSVPGMDSWFANPIAQASANLGVPPQPKSPTDHVHQYVNFTGRAAYANGVGYNQTPGPNDPRLLRNYMSSRALKWSTHFGWKSQNWYFPSIEFAGKYGEPLTPYQIETGAKINAWFILNSDQTLVPKTAEDMMFSHSEFDGINRKNCHGFTQQEWSAMKARTQQIITNATNGDTMTPEERQQLDKAITDLQTLRADFMYWVIGFHKPWIEQLHSQVNNDIIPRIQLIEQAIPVIRNVLGEQGRRIQALEDAQNKTTTITQSIFPVPTAKDMRTLDYIVSDLAAMLPRLETQDQALNREYAASFHAQQSTQPENSIPTLRVLIDTLVAVATDLESYVPIPMNQAAAVEPNPYPDAHGDMPPHLRDL